MWHCIPHLQHRHRPAAEWNSIYNTSQGKDKHQDREWISALIYPDRGVKGGVSNLMMAWRTKAKGSLKPIHRMWDQRYKPIKPFLARTSILTLNMEGLRLEIHSISLKTFSLQSWHLQSLLYGRYICVCWFTKTLPSLNKIPTQWSYYSAGWETVKTPQMPIWSSLLSVDSIVWPCTLLGWLGLFSFAVRGIEEE